MTGGSTAGRTRPRRLFGTDGVRGAFGEPPLTRETVTALGYHLARALGGPEAAPEVVLGGDTRDSTPRLCRWLATGLAAGGGAFRYAGVIPTPGVAWLVRRLGAATGVVVSASHNPHPDNGIKLIDDGGFKWRREREADLEERLARRREAPPGGDPGPLTADPALAEAYLEALAASLPGPRPLAGLTCVLDTANGAASPYAERLFAGLGADVEVLAASPDGININRGYGSTAPGAMATAVARDGHRMGFAFDGDADRVILADETGSVRDGDAILYLWAQELAAAGRLDPPRIVATSMSNLGLERALAREGVGVVRCDVGDREVVASMRREGILLGGEQSGHIVHLGLATTGDGLLTALQVAHLVARREEPVSSLLAGFSRYPQLLRNVRVRRKVDFAELPAVAAAARRTEESLGGDGRLVLRYSGTEPLARIMIEGPEQERIESLAGELARTIEEELG